MDPTVLAVICAGLYAMVAADEAVCKLLTPHWMTACYASVATCDTLEQQQLLGFLARSFLLCKCRALLAQLGLGVVGELATCQIASIDKRNATQSLLWSSLL